MAELGSTNVYGDLHVSGRINGDFIQLTDEVTIAAESFATYDLVSIFGATLRYPRDLMIEVKVLDTEIGSKTNNEWISATAVATYGLNISNMTLTLHNEFNTSLTFYIKARL